MTVERTAVVIQARMSSRRLPGKVLRDLAGVPAILRMMERVARVAALWVQGDSRVKAGVLANVRSGWRNSRMPDQRIEFVRGTDEVAVGNGGDGSHQDREFPITAAGNPRRAGSKNSLHHPVGWSPPATGACGEFFTHLHHQLTSKSVAFYPATL